jgi:hypothetical protein
VLATEGVTHSSDIEMDMHLYLFVEPLLASESAAASANFFLFHFWLSPKCPMIIHFQRFCAQKQNVVFT